MAIAPRGGRLGTGVHAEVVERTFATGRSIEFDALVVADGAPKDGDVRAVVMLQEASRHLKAIGARGDGGEVLAAAGIQPDAPGVLTGKKSDTTLAAGLIGALGLHRAWDRTPLIADSMTPPAA